MPGRLRTTSPADTRELGAAVASLAQPGDLLLLVGEMGAGKTAFAQGFAAGLGVTEPVTSPSFTLVHEYAGRLPLHHVDVYRLERLAELQDLALSELIDGEGVTLIEWGDVVLPALPSDYLEVRLAYGATEETRDVELRVIGPGWASRQRRLAEAVRRWAC